MRSTGETAAIQKRLFLRCGGTAKQSIAVREPAEAADDIGMYFGPFEILGISRSLVESDPALLIGKVLRVLKGKIKKAAQVRRNLAIEAPDNGTCGYGAGERVGGEG
jgi:hypothetical protein